MDPLTKVLTKTNEEAVKPPVEITTYENIKDYSTVKVLTDNKVKNDPRNVPGLAFNVYIFIFRN